jgi:hypothetical protein
MHEIDLLEIETESRIFASLYQLRGLTRTMDDKKVRERRMKMEIRSENRHMHGFERSVRCSGFLEIRRATVPQAPVSSATHNWVGQIAPKPGLYR